MGKIIIWLGVVAVVTLTGILTYRLTLPFEQKFFSKASTKNVLEKSPYYVDQEGWSFVMNGTSKNYTSYSFERNDSDTLKHIIFLINENDEAFEIFEYKKVFRLGNRFKCTVWMNSTDTLFSYVEKDNDEKLFIRGEYYFKYTFLKMTTDEMKYFLLYEDSLTRVRGNNLLRLPALDEVKRKQL